MRVLSHEVIDHLKTAGRRNASKVSCFVNSVGAGLQVAAACALLLGKANAAGPGHKLPDDWLSETVAP